MPARFFVSRVVTFASCASVVDAAATETSGGVEYYEYAPDTKRIYRMTANRSGRGHGDES
jgi:hypothetical protein